MKMNINKNYWLDVIAQNPDIDKITQKVANQTFKEEKERLMDLIDKHRISQELNEGVKGSSNIAALDDVEGDLYSFLGFPDGFDPVENLKKTVSRQVRLDSNKLRNKTRRKVYFIIVPSLDDVAVQTPMKYLSGRSWLSSIEEGISGLSHYISRTFAEGSKKFKKTNFEKSRSGGGLQVKGIIRKKYYRPQKYYTNIIERWLGRFE